MIADSCNRCKVIAAPMCCLFVLVLPWTLLACGGIPLQVQPNAQEHDDIQQDSGLPEDIQHNLLAHSEIAPNGVVSVIGRFLLIRDGSKYCGVKFTFPRKSEELPGETFRGPGRRYYADYETYFQGDGSGEFSKPNVEYRQGTTSILPDGYWPFPLFGYERGNRSIRCGLESYRWWYPSGIQMRKGEVFQLAPTQWSDIMEVDVRAPTIVWYGDDEELVQPFYIPLEKLPGTQIP